MLVYWIWLANKANVTDREKLAVLEHFGRPEDCFFADKEALMQVTALRKEAVETLCEKSLKDAESILHQCAKKNISILTWQDAHYPNGLKNIADPPLVLYYRGTLPDFDEEPMIGVVGTRKASAYGMQAAEKLGAEIASCGGIVVSGMAEGIDTMATQAALRAQKPAIGVLGCGVDRVYPPSNRELYRKVERCGCLLSEFPPGTAPQRWNFPKRNRIISGLSCGVVIVEAPLRSGALITARLALEQGRDVFVVPGNIGVASCEGSNALLKDGAAMITSGWDILEEYIYRYPDKIHRHTKEKPVADKKPVDKTTPAPYSDVVDTAEADETELLILKCLHDGEKLIDTIIADTGLPSAQVLAALTMLEVQGAVATRPGGWVRQCSHY